jgi:hypothetical protein
MIDTIDKHTQSYSRKVRLKCHQQKSLKRRLSFLVILCIISRVSAMETRNNRPPRFLIDDQHSEIVLRLREGPETPVGMNSFTENLLIEFHDFLTSFQISNIRQFNL